MDAPFDTPKLLEMMFGKPPKVLSRCSETLDKKVLEMKGISGTRTRTGLKDCNVVIRQGEVVGLAGLEGSGQGEFLRIAGGLRQPTKGVINEFFLYTKDLTKLWHKDYISQVRNSGTEPEN